jgi:NitT/TauT family transport system substrate-binding protein
VRVVGALASQPEGLGAVPLLVRKELADSGEVTSVADLEGRTVALNVPRGMAEYLLNKALEAEGLSIDDVETTNLPFPEHPQALANGAVDAAMLPHPLAAGAIGEGIAEVLVAGDQIVDNPQNGVLYFGARMLEPDNREVGVRFLVAYLRAARDLFGEGWREDANVAAINAFTDVPLPAIQNGVPYFFEPDGRVNLESMNDIIQYHVGRGYTEVDEAPSAEDLIVGDFLEEALARLGEFEQN